MADEKPDDEKLPDMPLWHQSGINPAGEPFVQLILGDKLITQMTPEGARDHARAMLESAEAAEQDAFIFDWVVNRVGAGDQQAIGLLQDFRQYRRERTGKSSGARDARDWVMPPPKEPAE